MGARRQAGFNLLAQAADDLDHLVDGVIAFLRFGGMGGAPTSADAPADAALVGDDRRQAGRLAHNGRVRVRFRFDQRQHATKGNFLVNRRRQQHAGVLAGRMLLQQFQRV